MTVPYSIRAWLLLVPLFPSLIVTLFNLYHLLKNRALRAALNNHVIILLLICGLIEELTDIPWYIHQYRTDFALSSTPAFCYTWAYIGSAIYVSNFILMAWASFERHILIFHTNLFATTRKRLLFYYLPLSVCVLSPVLFYLVMFFILNCDAPLNYNGALCDLYACVLTIQCH